MPPKKRAAATATASNQFLFEKLSNYHYYYKFGINLETAPASIAPKRGRKAKVVEEPVEEEEEVKKEEEKVEEITKDNIISKLKEADKKNKKIKVYHPDKNIPGFSNYSVIL